MTVDVILNIDEDCRLTLVQIYDRLLSGMGVVLGTSSMHRALQGMLYSIKKLCIEKPTMKSIDNKTKRMNLLSLLTRLLTTVPSEGGSRVGVRTSVTLSPSKGKNLHMQGGVSRGAGLSQLKPHEGSIKREESARFISELVWPH
ncbi:LOW QUALITY PROTEIN: Transposase [Phytophthora palmivora]|uniref:Transposase n=1 Tax=Phytophthora palmivora TaxID=4796 RepID=A0A2P4X7L1_9STRA|nr:LOW QUALITY PROTEIN: Transposase [Phytophthora palmivora]